MSFVGVEGWVGLGRDEREAVEEVMRMIFLGHGSLGVGMGSCNTLGLRTRDTAWILVSFPCED